MFECFHCGERAVVWGGDFDLADSGMEGEGVVHELHCSNCGAVIEYIIIEKEEDDGGQEEE